MSEKWWDGHEVEDSVKRVLAWNLLLRHPLNRHNWGQEAWKLRAEYFWHLLGETGRLSILKGIIEGVIIGVILKMFLG